MNKFWYFTIMTPLQLIPSFHRGEHPLTRSFYEKLQKDLSTKLSLGTGQSIPKEAIVVSAVMEIPEDIYNEWQEKSSNIV
jgi:hypothetical protein